MKIALLNMITPYVYGGAEILVNDLAVQLEERGHMADLYRVPQVQDLGRPFIDTMLYVSTMRFDNYDRVIGFKFPAYCVDHPRKVLWIAHQFRQAYELFGTEYGFQNTAEGRTLRNIYKGLDDSSIPKARHVFTISAEVTGRLKKYNGIDAEPLVPPIKNARLYKEGPFGDYVFYPSRIDDLKRQHLAIEAMKYVKSGARLIIAGRHNVENYAVRLTELISSFSLEKKVTFLDRWITDDEKVKLMSECLGALYVPYMEDYGYITGEAFYSGKPVISCTDSGGPLGLIEDGVNGFIVEPDPQSLAKAIDRLYTDKNKTAEMGKAAKKFICEVDNTWDSIVKKLLA